MSDISEAASRADAYSYMTSGIGEPVSTTSPDSSSSTCQTPPWRARSCHASWDQTSRVLHGHDELRRFFVKGTAGRPTNWFGGIAPANSSSTGAP